MTCPSLASGVLKGSGALGNKAYAATPTFFGSIECIESLANGARGAAFLAAHRILLYLDVSASICQVFSRAAAHHKSGMLVAV